MPLVPAFAVDAGTPRRLPVIMHSDSAAEQYLRIFIAYVDILQHATSRFSIDYITLPSHDSSFLLVNVLIKILGL